jgi:NADPH:quinone reductase-like Zn-dependent oxidoreductase
MKAVYITQHGGPEALTYGERPEPVIEPHEIKVRVRACALNRLDVYTRAGVRGTRRSSTEPLILGNDVAGDVVEVGGRVRSVKAGDRVVLDPVIACGQCDVCRAGQDALCPSRRMLGSTVDGGYAEYVKAPGANAFLLPDDLSYEDAAALPTTFMPSWRILVRQGQLKPWETALVLSASAGVGTAAIQVAKRVVGARVITTTSTQEKAVKARALGADEVIVYPEEDIEERVKALTGGRGVDMVLDHVGADFWEKAFASLAVGGRYGVCGVTTGYRAQLHLGLLFSKQLTLFGVMMGTKEDFRCVVDAARRGLIKPVISHTFPLEQAADAHRAMEDRAAFGKILLKV